MSKVRAFNCPNCGAAIDYKGGDDLTVECPYCDSSVIVPEELRPRKISLQLFSVKPARTVRRSTFVWVVVVFIIVGIITAVGILAAVGIPIAALSIPIAVSISDELGESPIATVVAEAISVEKAEPAEESFARVEFTFGSEGIGAGQFTDARHIAVDGNGNIYVGEYSDGRIQLFDPTGKFISLWMVDAKPLSGLAADRQGTVYVVQRGKILRYEGATGKLLGQVENSGGWRFKRVTVTADGGLVAACHCPGPGDDMVRFDAQGQVVWVVEYTVSGQTGPFDLESVAVDGLGSIYALDGFHDAVFKFSPEGQFTDILASAGEGPGHEPGKLDFVHGIAVDGRGRVYVSDFHGIQVFDGSGQYLATIDPDGPNFGITLNDQNQLLIAARHEVVVVELQLPE